MISEESRFKLLKWGMMVNLMPRVATVDTGVILEIMQLVTNLHHKQVTHVLVLVRLATHLRPGAAITGCFSTHVAKFVPTSCSCLAELYYVA